MSDIINWDTVAANNNATPPDGFPEGMNYSSVNNAARELMAAIRRWYDDVQAVGQTVGGSGDDITLTTNVAYTAYSDGMVFAITPSATNTGDVTIDVNGLGAVPALLADGSQIPAGYLVAGATYQFVYRSADGGFRMMAASSTGCAYSWYDDTSTAFTPDYSHQQKIGRLNNASPISVTIEDQATAQAADPAGVGWREGASLTLTQRGAGQITVVPAAGVTINHSDTLVTRKQHSTISLVYEGSDVWLLIGDVEAV